MAFELVSSVDLTTSTATISFTAIPQTGQDLVIIFNPRTGRTNIVDELRVQFNSDTSASYNSISMIGNGSTTSSSAITSGTSGRGDYVSGNSSVASSFSNHQIYIYDYAQSTYAKNVSIESIHENNNTVAYQTFWNFTYTPTTAITSISLSAITSFAQYSSASLYIIS